MNLKLVTHPNKILRQPCQEVDLKMTDLQKLIKAMKEFMLKYDGLGLAAPQIGLSIRLIVINHADGPIALINPIIRKKYWRSDIQEEGCLSLPNIFGTVKRKRSIKVSYQNIEGKTICIKAKGLLARVIQHEVDHLNGVLIIDKFEDGKK